MIADGESRHFHSQDTEWMLNTELLTGALKTLNFQPEIDLFDSRLNRQLSDLSTVLNYICKGASLSVL